MPCADIRSIGVLSRVALRAHLYNAMETGWASRPSVRIGEDPRAWWRHALHMVLRECRKVRRRRVTLFAAARKRKLRQKYQSLYRRVHQGSAHYTDPDRRQGSLAAGAAAIIASLGTFRRGKPVSAPLAMAKMQSTPFAGMCCWRVLLTNRAMYE